MPIELSIVIPVYNEADNISSVINVTANVMDKLIPESYEIILIDDGSTDNSHSEIMKCALKSKHILNLKHEINKGMGAALNSGLQIAKGRYWTFLPSDGEITATEVEKLFHTRAINSLTLGERTSLQKGEYKQVRPFHRELISFISIKMIQLSLGIDLKGNESIYIASTEFLKAHTFKSNTGLFNLEVIYWFRKKGLNINRIPINISRRISGQSKVMNPRGILKQLIETIKLGFKLRMSN